MKIANKPAGTIKTRDAQLAGLKVSKDIAKLDTNRDGTLTKAEVAAGEKRLHIDAAERKMISQVLSSAIPQHGGVSTWSATIIGPYVEEHLSSLDTKSTGTVNAKDLGKLTFPKGEGKFGIDRVATRLAPDLFEYVQAEEKAGKKF